MLQVISEKKSGFWKAQVGLFRFHSFPLSAGPQTSQPPLFCVFLLYCITMEEMSPQAAFPSWSPHGREGAVSSNHFHLAQASERVVQEALWGVQEPGLGSVPKCCLMMGIHNTKHTALEGKVFFNGRFHPISV